MVDLQVVSGELQRERLVVPREGIAVRDLRSLLNEFPEEAVVSLGYDAGAIAFEALGVVINCNEHSVSGPSGVSFPTRREFGIVRFLAERADCIQSREEILEGVWRKGYIGDLHVVDVHLSNARERLRKQAGIPPATIRTVRGVGFVFRSQPAHQEQASN